IPKIRIRKDQNATTQRIWNWASKESPVCDGTADEEYTLSVQTCNNNFPIDSRFCRPYKDSGVTYYKPSGLLQNYMESDGNKTCSLVGNKACNTDSDCNFATEGICVDKAQMFMGLFTGTYTKNLSGGVLRKNIYGIYDEIQQNGILQSAESDQGNIIITLDRMEVIGYDYTSNFYKNSSQTGNCEWMVDRPLSQGECVMWGNPIGEMMYEGMRYFAEKTAATSAYTQGTTNDLTLALHEQEWGIKKSSTHYALSKIYPACSKRFMLVISDVNNNFDSDQVPDPNFGSFTGDLTGFSAKTLQSTIGKSEGLNGTTAFIGQYGNNTDFLCSAKSIGDLGYARGLCPEEPTKQGSYTPAAAAYYGHKMMTEKTGKMNVDTLAVALASPIPDVKMKLKGKDVRLAPAGKTVSGTYWYGDPYAACAKQRNLSRRTMPGGALAGNNTNGTLVIGNCTSGFPNCRTTSYCPSNTIVDFYIEKLPDPGNATQRMVFRVNFEDVEQGADHDMDAIVKYTVVGDNNTGTLKVSLDSSATGCGAAKCASGGYDEVLGFVISGTGNGTANTDGAWLVVRDDDVPGTNSTTTPKVISSLPKKWSRTFQVKGGAAGVMKDPLWYAAKWGGFADYNHNKKPDLDPEWDRTGGGQNGTEPDGDPDNYFFVANPLKLYDQLNAAFAMALAKKGSAGAVATVTQEINQGDVLVRAAFESFDEALSTTQLSWKGHLES
ncbi:MAG TPA: pilus assembly protein PilY, partial [Syntrophobacteraceae bacterium]|nr:pilus assembly protein PilY [Syntrophobacteraceae bacterium]